MSASIRFKPWTRGTDPITPSPPLLIPASEPLSVGQPPHAPGLVARLTVAETTRRVVCRSGQPVTCTLETASRPTFTVAWDGLTPAERDEVVAFLRTEVNGTRYAFTVAIDADEAGEDLVIVRPLRDPTITWQSLGAWSVEAECEEVFS